MALRSETRSLFWMCASMASTGKRICSSRFRCPTAVSSSAFPPWCRIPTPRLVLCDDADGVADRAATRAEALGYRHVHVLSGGVEAWSSAGYTLYAGVNVPSKTFGELVEHERHTPRVTAQDLQALRASGDDIVIVDGRTFAEFQKMSIPGGICCPNGELALRIGDLVPDPKTKIIVNCAGRTRSIIGAQTLIDLGIPNPVFALENGTQGWFLAGQELENGASRRYGNSANDLGEQTGARPGPGSGARSRVCNREGREPVARRSHADDLPARRTNTRGVRGKRRARLHTRAGWSACASDRSMDRHEGCADRVAR